MCEHVSTEIMVIISKREKKENTWDFRIFVISMPLEMGFKEKHIDES